MSAKSIVGAALIFVAVACAGWGYLQWNESAEAGAAARGTAPAELDEATAKRYLETAARNEGELRTQAMIGFGAAAICAAAGLAVIAPARRRRLPAAKID
jgi:hypothetical protein